MPTEELAHGAGWADRLGRARTQSACCFTWVVSTQHAEAPPSPQLPGDVFRRPAVTRICKGGWSRSDTLHLAATSLLGAGFPGAPCAPGRFCVNSFSPQLFWVILVQDSQVLYLVPVVNFAQSLAISRSARFRASCPKNRRLEVGQRQLCRQWEQCWICHCAGWRRQQRQFGWGEWVGKRVRVSATLPVCYS